MKRRVAKKRESRVVRWARNMIKQSRGIHNIATIQVEEREADAAWATCCDDDESPIDLTVDDGDEYACASCGGTFTATVSHDEAIGELEQNFGAASALPYDVVCDDCYQQMQKPN